jgi:hypothetical protein
MQRADFTQAEAHLRAAYEGLSRTTGTSFKPMNDYKAIETDRPFAMLVLDKLARLMLRLRRTAEAWSYAAKFVQAWARYPYPGNGDELHQIFERRIPISFALASEWMSNNNKLDLVLEPFEKTLNEGEHNLPVSKEWLNRGS